VPTPVPPVTKLPLSIAQTFTQRDWLRAWVPTVLIAVGSGSASAFFLWSLDRVTLTRWQHPWLLAGLPLFGIGIALAYEHFGGRAGRGTNLVLDALHDDDTRVPRRLLPFVLGSTLLTHLGGGSAGREGTAVQMGAGVAAALLRHLRNPNFWLRRWLVLAGVASGFGAVFGTPWAGALFALEFLHRDSFRSWRRLAPGAQRGLLAAIPLVLTAAWTGHAICLLWGIHHTSYSVSSPTLTPTAFGLAALVGAAASLVARLYVISTESIVRLSQRIVPRFWLRPIIGAGVVLGLSRLLGTDAYLGLGVTHPNPEFPSIVHAFQAGGATPWSWLWKLALTAITLGTGFKGGEVTPLFFVGAALGNTLGQLTGTPVDLAAALGFIAVFAGASRTPVTCAVMGAELFGGRFLPPGLLACTLALWANGPHGLYSAQRNVSPVPRSAPLV